MTDNGAYSDVVFGLFRLLGQPLLAPASRISGARASGASIRRPTTAH